MILVKDLNKDIFSSPFLKYLPETCDSCGSPTEILETLSSLQCSNRHCISKVGYRLFALLQDLGINELTVDECIEFLKGFDTLNPYSIFLYNPEEDGELFEGFGEEKSLNLYSELNKKRAMLLWEFIRIGHFDNLSVSAEKLLKDYSDLNDFYADLVEGGIPFIQKLLLKDTDFEESTDICVDAVILYEVFVYYKSEIEEGLNGVVILNPEIKLSVLFANDVKSFNSNQDFLFTINRKLKNKIYLYPAYQLDDSVSFVFWQESSVNSYNSIIKAVKENYSHIPLVNEDNILSVMLGVLSSNG